MDCPALKNVVELFLKEYSCFLATVFSSDIYEKFLLELNLFEILAAKIQQTKILVIGQRFGDLFSFWQYFTN